MNEARLKILDTIHDIEGRLRFDRFLCDADRLALTTALEYMQDALNTILSREQVPAAEGAPY